MMVFAHRGGKALGPENTIKTMQKSLDAGAHGLEMDIRCTLDDRPVVIHDATLDRTTNGSGEVYQMTGAGLKNVVTEDGRAVPSLSEVIDAVGSSGATLLLELKHPATAMPTADLVSHAIKTKSILPQKLVIVTFYHQLIALIKDTFPHIVTGAALRHIPESLAAAGEYTGSRYVLPPIDEVSEEFVQDAHKRNLQVVPYVVESSQQLELAKHLKVDGVIAHDPVMALK